jgi:hypothetical protein
VDTQWPDFVLCENSNVILDKFCRLQSSSQGHKWLGFENPLTVQISEFSEFGNFKSVPTLRISFHSLDREKNTIHSPDNVAKILTHSLHLQPSADEKLRWMHSPLADRAFLLGQVDGVGSEIKEPHVGWNSPQR